MSVDDLVIKSLADENAELRERAAMAVSYREALQLAIAQLADQSRELETARRRIATLVEENRSLRKFRSEATSA